MYDYIKLVKKLPHHKQMFLPQMNPSKLFDLQFDPVFKGGEIIKHMCKFNGLRLTIIGSELIIQNSLCKFYHNYNDVNLSFTELLRTKTILEEKLGLCLNDASVKSFEYGVVISVTKPPLVYNSFGLYKNRKPQEMTYNGSIYGVSYENTTHKFKIYDKTKEARRNGFKLNYGLLRIEKRVSQYHLKSSPRFKNNPVNTFGNLCKRKTIQLLVDDLIRSLTQIELNDIAYYVKDLSLKDLRLLGYMQNIPIRSLVKEHHSKAYELDIKRYRQILLERHQSNHFDLVQKVFDTGERILLD